MKFEQQQGIMVIVWSQMTQEWWHDWLSSHWNIDQLQIVVFDLLNFSLCLSWPLLLSLFICKLWVYVEIVLWNEDGWKWWESGAWHCIVQCASHLMNHELGLMWSLLTLCSAHIPNIKL